MPFNTQFTHHNKLLLCMCASMSSKHCGSIITNSMTAGKIEKLNIFIGMSLKKTEWICQQSRRTQTTSVFLISSPPTHPQSNAVQWIVISMWQFCKQILAQVKHPFSRKKMLCANILEYKYFTLIGKQWRWPTWGPCEPGDPSGPLWPCGPGRPRFPASPNNPVSP